MRSEKADNLNLDRLVDGLIGAYVDWRAACDEVDARTGVAATRDPASARATDRRALMKRPSTAGGKILSR